jgi:hypothetical protein
MLKQINIKRNSFKYKEIWQENKLFHMPNNNNDYDN